MKIGDEVYIHGYVDEIRQNVVIIRNDGGYFGTVAEEITNKSEMPTGCGDAISRESIKQKLQEHHDFYVDAYGGFSNLPQNDKSRVDEITNCIAMVVNEPSVTPQPRTGRWIKHFDEIGKWYECDQCHTDWGGSVNYCPNCGAKMGVEE